MQSSKGRMAVWSTAMQELRYFATTGQMTFIGPSQQRLGFSLTDGRASEPNGGIMGLWPFASFPHHSAKTSAETPPSGVVGLLGTYGTVQQRHPPASRHHHRSAHERHFCAIQPAFSRTYTMPYYAPLWSPWGRLYPAHAAQVFPCKWHYWLTKASCIDQQLQSYTTACRILWHVSLQSLPHCRQPTNRKPTAQNSYTTTAAEPCHPSRHALGRPATPYSPWSTPLAPPALLPASSLPSG